jgi:predicted  nucleic acid-binding Zn-ribbon protein
MINCPRCGRIQYYVCANVYCECWKRLPLDANPQIQLPNDIVACPYCGFASHMDFWVILEMQDT